MPETSTSENQNQVSLKELREEFYKIRKFEIQNLWQRSIFLATFIVLLFTGYGAFFEKLMSYDGLQSIIGHIICSLLALTGSIFSMLWIMMAKGSKAWYEIYERRIHNIEKETTLNIPKKYRMDKEAPWTLDNSLLSRKPGAYSVSRINILLGQVLWVIWIVAFTSHLIKLSIFESQTKPELRPIISIGITFALAIELTIPHLLENWVQSGAILAPHKKKKKKLPYALPHPTYPIRSRPHRRNSRRREPRPRYAHPHRHLPR